MRTERLRGVMVMGWGIYVPWGRSTWCVVTDHGKAMPGVTDTSETVLEKVAQVTMGWGGILKKGVSSKA